MYQNKIHKALNNTMSRGKCRKASTTSSPLCQLLSNRSLCRNISNRVSSNIKLGRAKVILPSNTWSKILLYSNNSMCNIKISSRFSQNLDPPRRLVQVSSLVLLFHSSNHSNSHSSVTHSSVRWLINPLTIILAL